MKKILLTLVLLVGVVFGLMAQNLTYQAVIRDNNQQLVTNTVVKATVTITFSTGNPYTTEVNGSTNIHGLLSIEFGGDALNGRNWEGATIAVKVVKANDESIVYVNEVPRPVSAVPYALSVNGQSIQNYLTEHHYVNLDKLNDTLKAYPTTAAMEARHYLTSDSAVIKTMRSDIAKNADGIDNLILHTAKAAIRDSVAGQVHDSISAISSFVEQQVLRISNDTIYLTGGSYVKLPAGFSGDYNDLTNKPTLFSGNYDDLSNKPTIPTVPTAVSAFSNDAGYLTKDSATITSLTDLYNILSEQINAQNNQITVQNARMDSLAHLVDSLAKLPHGGDTPATFTCGTDKVKDVAGNKYPTVKIGNQCWMAKNLRTEPGKGKAKNPGGNADNVPTYGLLYNWKAVMQGASSTTYPVQNNPSDTMVRGICPEGWHVPSNAEWDTLTTYVKSKPKYRCGDNADNIANALSAAMGWDSTIDCGAGSNSATLNKTGFSAVPAGLYNSTFSGFGKNAYFWSSTKWDIDHAWCRRLRSHDSIMHSPKDTLGTYYSVRCLRDAGIGGGTTPSTPATVSCEQVMECMGDTLGKLNTKIESQGAEIETLNGTVTTQGNTIDSLAHLVDSLSKLPHGGGETAIVDTVVCYPNLGSNDSVKKTVTRGQDLDLSTTFTHPVEANWEIASWNTKADGTGTSYTNTLTTSGNLTLYAQWRTFCTGTPSSANEVGSGRIDSLKDVENNKYAVVQIGNQCWMKENLRTKTHTYGQVWTKTDADSAIYGRYYDWQAAMQIDVANDQSYTAGDKHRGICPEGWHVPSNAEWDTLTAYVNSVTDYRCRRNDNAIANALSSPTGWQSPSECAAGHSSATLNQTGFAAVPAGYCFDGSFDNFGNNASFWSATQSGDGHACCWYLYSGGSFVYSILDSKGTGFSVRCVRDN